MATAVNRAPIPQLKIKKEYLQDERVLSVARTFAVGMMGITSNNIDHFIHRAAYQSQTTDELTKEALVSNDRIPFLSSVLGRVYADLTDTPPVNAKVETFIQDNFSLAREMLVSAKPGSNQEYLSLSILEAMLALNKGNFGIGSIYMIKDGNKEYIVSGQNSLFSEGFPHGHAEHNAMKNVVILSKGDMRNYDDVIAVRDRVDGKTDTHSELTTSLEPCPMCMMGILNHEGQTGKSFKRVIIGAEDKGGAFWLNWPRLKLPAAWMGILERSGISVDVAEFKGDSEKKSKFYNDVLKKLWRWYCKFNKIKVEEVYDTPEIDQKYKDLMFRVFLDFVQETDEKISSGDSKVVDIKQAANTIEKNFPY